VTSYAHTLNAQVTAVADSQLRTHLKTVTSLAEELAHGFGGQRARYVPERRSHRGQSRCLTVSGTVDRQVSRSAASRAGTPLTSRADSATEQSSVVQTCGDAAAGLLHGDPELPGSHPCRVVLAAVAGGRREDRQAPPAGPSEFPRCARLQLPGSRARLPVWGPWPYAAVAATCAARHVRVGVRALQAPY